MITVENKPNIVIPKPSDWVRTLSVHAYIAVFTHFVLGFIHWSPEFFLWAASLAILGKVLGTTANFLEESGR